MFLSKISAILRSKITNTKKLLQDDETLKCSKWAATRNLSMSEKIKRDSIIIIDPQDQKSLMSSDNFESKSKRIIVYEPKNANVFDPDEMRKYIRRFYRLNIVDKPTSIQINCPYFSRFKRINIRNLYIHKTTGFVYCYRCFKTFTHWDLHDLLSLNKQTDDTVCYYKETLPFVDLSLVEYYSQRLTRLNGTSTDDLSCITVNFNYEKMKPIDLDAWEVMLGDNKELVAPLKIPNPEKTETRGAIILSESSGEPKISYFPNKGYFGLFGKHSVKKKSVIFTANIFDTIRLSKCCDDAVFMIPDDFLGFKYSFLPFFEDYEKIIFWVTDSYKNNQLKNVKSLANLMGPDRSYIFRQDFTFNQKRMLNISIKPEIEDSNSIAPPPSDQYTEETDINVQTQRMGKLYKKIFSECRAVSGSDIVSFKKLKDDVYNNILNIETEAGIKWKRFTELNLLLKGHRMGELTILTGRTGCGKTTFLSEYSLDLAMNGVKTLWGSFEICNQKLLRTLLSQFYYNDIALNIDKFDSIAEEFSKVPIWYMNSHGDQNIDQVMDVLAKSVYIHDIQHVVIDNLQFMMGMTILKSHSERFMIQDRVIYLLREFATKYNCHVTLVIHPRKESNGDDLSISSVFGSAKSTQEADNIMILQTKNHGSVNSEKSVQITKNRFDGVLGVFQLNFNPESLTLSHNRGDGLNLETVKFDVNPDVSKLELQQADEKLKEIVFDIALKKTISPDGL